MLLLAVVSEQGGLSMKEPGCCAKVSGFYSLSPFPEQREVQSCFWQGSCTGRAVFQGDNLKTGGARLRGII